MFENYGQAFKHGNATVYIYYHLGGV